MSLHGRELALLTRHWQGAHSRCCPLRRPGALRALLLRAVAFAIGAQPSTSIVGSLVLVDGAPPAVVVVFVLILFVWKAHAAVGVDGISMLQFVWCSPWSSSSLTLIALLAVLWATGPGFTWTSWYMVLFYFFLLYVVVLRASGPGFT
eukprot:CAMPEP_0170574840 /NCGR_PEP_ID=MMETSP0224-20130122/3520_1 /TAXON_ID=285029 /ORGANISM="Togula jolla, Strain CCCM 725" /LENGTH=147 /DNA_ID=CAMNT_0010897535 /DNA_START=83 /DNA_END=526 /DNA_ORIENTATION=-